MRRIDLNVDIGEGFAHDAALLEFATSANVCCGEHAGSWDLTLQTIELCRSRGVRVGMHPGYADRETMGRGTPTDDRGLSRSLLGQAHEFMKVCPASYIKPHGAWYNQIVSGQTVGRFDPAAPLLSLVKEFRIPAMILPVYKGLPSKWVIREGFCDRAYLPDGRLMPRSEPGAVLLDPDAVRRQVLQLAGEVDSLCLHGDTPDCLIFAELVKKTLEDAGFEVHP